MAVYRIATVFLAMALFVPSPGAATAGLDDGFAAYERGEYDTAFRQFMPLAHAGDPSAQGMIALMHQHGLGTPQDYGDAARWWRLSAERKRGIILGRD